MLGIPEMPSRRNARLLEWAAGLFALVCLAGGCSRVHVRPGDAPASCWTSGAGPGSGDAPVRVRCFPTPEECASDVERWAGLREECRTRSLGI
jgi:hypothetical protein